MELLGISAGLILLTGCFYFQKRPSRSSNVGLLLLFASVFYFSQWLVVVCASFWLIRHNVISPNISLISGMTIGFLLGGIDAVYCFTTEALTPEEQIGGGCIGIFCFFFSLLCGAVFSAFFN